MIILFDFIFQIFLASNVLSIAISENKSLGFFRKITRCDPLIGTTPNLKEIMVGRCHYFKQLSKSSACTVIDINFDCDKIWTAFDGAIRSGLCSIDRFDEFLNLTSHPIPQNETVFWSGTYTLTHQYTKKHRFWSLEDTLTGFLVDDLSFCSFNTTSYVYNKSCSNDCIYRNFWNAISIDFAKRSSGNAIVVLNGSRSIGAISNTSTFFRYEVPNLSDKVIKLTVMLLRNPDAVVYETCEQGPSLNLLKEELKKKNITYECIDNPKEILFYMCFQDPLSKECQSVSFSLNSSSTFQSRYFILSLLSILICLTLV